MNDDNRFRQKRVECRVTSAEITSTTIYQFSLSFQLVKHRNPLIQLVKQTLETAAIVNSPINHHPNRVQKFNSLSILINRINCHRNM